MRTWLNLFLAVLVPFLAQVVVVAAALWVWVFLTNKPKENNETD